MEGEKLRRMSYICELMRTVISSCLYGILQEMRKETSMCNRTIFLRYEIALLLKCGTELREDAKFCHKCGAPIRREKERKWWEELWD